MTAPAARGAGAPGTGPHRRPELPRASRLSFAVGRPRGGVRTALAACLAVLALLAGVRPAQAQQLEVTDLTATANGYTKIDLSWTAPSLPEGVSISGYGIQVSLNGNGGWTDLVRNTSSDETAFSHTELTAGATRYYRMRWVYTERGDANPDSNVATATTDALPAPTGLTATAAGPLRIDLSWTAPAIAADAGGITGYRIEASPSGTGGTWTNLAATTGATGTTYSDGVTAGTTRHYRVSAVNAEGTSVPSNVATATTAAPTRVPGAPTRLTATANGQTRIDLSWTAPREAVTTGVTGYKIEVSPSGGAGTWTVLAADTGGTGTTYGHTGLTAGTTRHYRVSAVNALGAGSSSAEVSATTDAAGDLTVTALPGALKVSWPRSTARFWFRYELEWGIGSYPSKTRIREQGTTNATITNLAGGTAYAVRWRSVVTADSPWTYASGTPLLGKVGGVTATAASTTSLQVGWSAVSGAERYAVQWKSGAQDWSTERQAETTTTAHTISDLAPGTAYTVRVQARLTGMAPGEWSDQSTATTDTPSAAPGRPTGLTATASSSTRIDLSWTAPAETSASIVTGYKIESSPSGAAGSWTDLVADTGGRATTHSDTVTVGTTRHYRVSAVNAAGTSDPSNEASATAAAATAAPGRPTGLTGTAIGRYRIDLSWTAPTSTAANAPTGYRIEYLPRKDWIVLVADTGSTATTYSHTGLEAGTVYGYRVSAINAIGSSGPSEKKSIRTLRRAPTGLSATAKGQARIDLSWAPPVIAAVDSAEVTTGYEIQKAPDGRSWSTLVNNTGGTGTTYSDTTAEPGTTRHYRVVTLWNGGRSQGSVPASATTDPLQPPTNLTARANGKTAIDLSWRTPSGLTDADAPTGYKIEVSPSGTAGSWTDLAADTGGAGTTYGHTGLTAGTERHYRVSTINANGTSAPSNEASATTEAAGTLDAPTGLTATADGANRIDLSWTAPSGTPTGYKIETSPSGDDGSWITLEFDTGNTGTTYAHTGLAPGTERHYRVSAIDATGASAPSTAASTTTTTPAGIRVEPLPGALKVSWDAVAGANQGYDLSWKSGGQRYSHRIGSGRHVEVRSSTTYTIAGLTSGTKYDVRMRAWASGSPIAIREASGTPRLGKVSGVTAAAASSSSLRIEWSAAAGAQSYAVQWRSGTQGWSGERHATTTGTSHTISGLKTGTPYTVRVRARRSGMPPGAWSDKAEAHTNAPIGAPRAPTGLTATAAGPLQIDLSWTAPAGAASAGVTGYRIDASPSGAAESWSTLAADTGSTGTAYSDTDLTPETTRHYRVFAINAAGASDPSNTASAATTAAAMTAPGKPTGLTATPGGLQRINLDWRMNAATTAAGVTGYRIEYKNETTGEADWTTAAVDTGTAKTSYSHAGLITGFRYRYRVSAINAIGTGPPSDEAVGTTFKAAVQNFTVTPNGQSRIDLSWTHPRSIPSEAPDRYIIQVSSDRRGQTGYEDLATLANTATAYSHTGLPPRARRWYIVIAQRDGGTNGTTPPKGATTDPLKPPTKLTATANGQTRIDLSWTAPAGLTAADTPTGYKIESSPSGAAGSWTDLVADTGSADTEYGHSVAPSTTRHYRVSTINANGTSGPSNEADAATAAAGKPTAPTGLTAKAFTTRIDLSWTAPLVVAADTPTGYRIEVSPTGADGTWTDLAADTGGTDTTYSHIGLSAGTTRHYRVSAIGTGGTSDPSNVASDTTTNHSVEDLAAEANGPAQIDLSWTAPSLSGGLTAGGYRIQVSLDGTSGWTDLTTNTGSAATTYSHTELTADSTRHYRLRGLHIVETQVEDDLRSNVASATTDTATAPGAPTGLTATADGQTRIDLSWTAPADTGGVELTGYKIEASPTGADGTWTDLAADTASTDTEYSDSDNIAAGTTRHYRVSGINSAGTGGTSNEASATTISDPPTGLAATAVGAMRIDLSWTAPTGGGVTGYKIDSSPTGVGGTWTVLTADTGSTDTEYSDTGLPPEVIRYYRVSAINAGGASEPSNVAHATTSNDGPTGLTATATGSGEVDLSWTATEVVGQTISDYFLQWESTSPVDLGERRAGSIASTATVRGLRPGTSYTFYVRAVFSDGEGSQTATATATTHAATAAPGKPTGLSATATSETSIYVSWTAAAGQGVTGYAVEFRTGSGGWTAAETDTRNSYPGYDHIGLEPETRYEYRVLGGNTAGTGPWSDTAEATTPAYDAIAFRYEVGDKGVWFTPPARARQEFKMFMPEAYEPGANPPHGPYAYALTLEDGGALPYWLRFDAATRTLTPAREPGPLDNAVKETITLKWTAAELDDPDVSASQTFTLYRCTTEEDHNIKACEESHRDNYDPGTPAFSREPTDQTATEGETFSYTAPEATDSDNDPITYSAELADGSALPDWLVFTATTRVFAGTPGADDAPDELEIKVTASDGTHETSAYFTLTVEESGNAVGNANSPPAFTSGATDQTATEGELFSYTVPEADDPDENVLTYTAALTDGNALPEWLSFTASSRKFSGTPGAGDVTAELGIEVTATDDGDPPLSGSTTFGLTVEAAGTAGASNTAPAFRTAPTDQTATEGKAFSYAVPAAVDAENHTLTYSAAPTDGGSLPAWLSFAAATGTFSGEPGAADAPATLKITVTATDDGTPPESGSTRFTLTVEEKPPTPPSADAGSDVEARRGEKVTLSGSGTPHAEGSQALTYSWRIAGASNTELAGRSGNLAGADAATATATFTVPRRRDMTDRTALDDGESIDFELTVTDGDGDTATDTVTVTIKGTIWKVVYLTVADAEANESAGSIGFSVSLSEAAVDPVSVAWATADGTAVAGADYTAASGTLTFAVGETAKTVTVTVLDDAHDEGTETFTLTLSNPQPAGTATFAEAADAVATGSIKNADPLPRAWTARFGRTVAVHVLDSVEARLEAVSASHLRLGGHAVGDGPDARGTFQGPAPGHDLWAQSAAPGPDMTVRQLLLGSDFHLVSNAEDQAPGPRLSAWGRVVGSDFDGRENGVSMGGSVTTATVGVDGAWRRWLTGLLMAYSEGEGSFTHTDLPGGDLASTLTSAHPYVAYALSDRVRLWGLVGYGSGSLQLRLEDARVLDTDLTLTMGALGVRGSLLKPTHENGLQLALRSDVLWMRVDSAAAHDLAATEADASRLRLALEGSRPVALAGGGSLTPSLELGLRHDGGDAETGTGVEIGGSLRYATSWGLSVEASVRGLLAHEARGYREWGAGGALRFDPGRQGRGLTASIAPAWGSGAGGLSSLWDPARTAGLAANTHLATDAAGRLEAELGYGLAALRGRGLLTPYARVALTEGADQAWHLGTRLALAETLNLSLEAGRRAREGATVAHEVALLANLGW